MNERNRKIYLCQLLLLATLVSCSSPMQTPAPIIGKTLPPTWTDSPTLRPSPNQTPISATPESPTSTQVQLTATPSFQPAAMEIVKSDFVSPIDDAYLVYIAAGEFIMGASQEDVISIIDECIEKFGAETTKFCEDRYFAETPQHTVFLDDYWIDKYEVTNMMFAAFLNDIGWWPYMSEPYYVWADRMPKIFISFPEDSWVVDEGYENYPIHDVHWQGAYDYCQWAGRRLPTEAEWEKAARGDDGRQYPWGNEEPSSDLANFDWRYVAVDQLPNGASPYGVFNMVGNVQEWVADWYSSSYYNNSPDLNPYGPRIGTYRVVRGGVDLELQIMRTTFRDYGYIDNTVRSRYGFRCATSSNQ